MKKIMMGLGLATLLAGCGTYELDFITSSAPVPPQGYTVVGEPVSGTCAYNRILGVGGSVTKSQQFCAFQDAMEQSNGADALVNMTIDKHLYSPICISLLWSVETVRVTGTPVKYNKK